MKKVLVLLLTVCVLTLSIANDGVIFYTSFDKSFDADVAKGDKTASIKGKGKLVEGRLGQGYMQDSPGSITFSSPDNLNGAEGTVAFWVKSVNWNGKDRVFRYFFNTGRLSSRPHFQLYKYYNGGLMWLVRHSATKKKLDNLGLSLDKWKAGEWHHIAVSWSVKEKKCYLYFDGKRYEGKFIDKLFPAQGESFGSRFAFAFISDSPHHNSKDRSIYDELYIYDRMIGDKGINHLISKTAKKNVKTRFELPQTTKAPVIDGKLSPGEYDNAVSSNTFVITNKAGFEPRECRFYASYDAENIYIAIKSRTKGDDLNVGMKSRAKKRDSEVYLDDAVELFVKPPKGPLTQIVVNSIGTIFDMQNGNTKWNGNYKIANLIEDNWWVCEIKIPFKELGVAHPQAGDKWNMHIARDWKSPFVFVSLADCQSFADVKLMPEFVFTGSTYGATTRLNIKHMLAMIVDIDFTVGNNEAKATEYLSRIYLMDHQGRKVSLDSKKVKLATGEKAKLKLYKDLNKLDLSLFQNKLGIELLRDNKIIQQAEYALKVFPALTIKTFTITSRSSVKVLTDITGLVKPLDELTINYTILLNGQELRRWSEKNLSKRIIEKLIKFDSFEALKSYKLLSVVRGKDGRVLEQSENIFAFPGKEVWSDTQVGLGDIVPAPWKPLEYNKNMVKAWAKEYRFGAEGLPVTMTSVGEQLLSKPISLNLQTARGKVKFTPSGVKFTRQDKAETDFIATSESNKFELSVKGRMEFDGFLWYELTLVPKGKQLIKSLTLDIPINKALSKYVTTNRSGSGYASYGKLQKFIGDIEAVSQIIFCNDDAALAWFTESYEHFRPQEANKALSVIPGKNSVTLRINFIRENFTIDKPLKYAFGFQTGPLKPMPKGWQGWLQSYNGKHSKDETIAQLWSWSRWYGFVRPHADKQYRKLISDLKNNHPKMRLQPYLCQYILSTLAPEYKYYSEEWVDKPETEMPSFGPKYPGSWKVACLGSKSYRDFWLYSLDKYNAEYKTNGYYWDSIDPRACMNEYHGHGYVDKKGRRQETYDILNYREFYKRAYIMLKQRYPDAIVTGHASQRRHLATIGFSDVVYDGEQFVSHVSGNPNYCKVINDDFCRIFFGKQFGLVPLFLPAYYNNEKQIKKMRHPTESIWLHALIYNFLVHSHRVNNTVSDEIYDITRSFKLDDALYIAPWEKEKQAKFVIIKPDNYSKLRTALYIKPNGKILIVIGNFGDKKLDCTIKLNKPMKLIEKRTGKVLSMDNGVYLCSVPKYNFVLLQAE